MRLPILRFLTAAIILSGCGASDAAGWHAKWGGSLEDYEVIFDESDCGELEDLIEETVSEITRTSLTEDRLERSSIVQAAFHRMVQLECAEAYHQ